MLILEAENVKKYYGDRLIVAFDQLKIQEGDKIGIVGPNGTGKTTLLNIIAGETSPDEGIIKKYGDIAYIKQFSSEPTTADGKTLKEFGVRDKSSSQECSGGEHSRLKIAAALSTNSSLLLADEPSSNLDYQGIALLKKKLKQTTTFLLISHDRDLLDELCTQIIEIRDGRLKFFKGNYSAYLLEKELASQNEWSEYEQYLAEKARLENAVREQQGKSSTMRKAPKRMGNSEARLHKGKTTEKKKKLDGGANQLKSRLEKLEVKIKPQETSSIKLDFSLTHPPANKIVLSADQLNFSYGNQPLFDQAIFKVYNGLKTALIGDNGTGKTTLLHLISRKDEQIHLVPKAVCGYFYQGFENLDASQTVLENIMADSIQTETTARAILARLLISGDQVHTKIGVLSGGEKIKLSLAKLMVSNANILLLDEPTNYLDMPSIEALEKVLVEYAGTVLFVSHDRAFIHAVAQRLLVIKNKSIIEFDGNLEEFEEKQKLASADNDTHLQKTILQMRLAEITAKLSLTNADRAALEAEFQHTIGLLKQLE